MKKIFAFFSLALLIACSGNDRDDDQINITNNPEAGDNAPVQTLSTEINDFIWEGLNQYYYWQSQVPNLADTKDDDSNAYITFLNSIPDNEDFFDSLNHMDDRFSWIESDYQVLENQLSGISASNGMEFIIYRRCDSCNELIGLVTYVLPDSDAAGKNIQRGDWFSAVDGTELHVNNYRQLLYGSNLTYEITLVNFDPSSGDVTPRNETVSLTKVEDFQEIPIHKNLVLEQNGNRIGYLMYNQFVSGFNQELIDAFSGFASQNITDLVLDLRYNGGGSVQTCTYLASMITGQFDGEIFAQQVWNEKLMAYFNERNTNNDPDDDFNLNNLFTNQTTDGTQLPALGLQRVYILTTNRSASASELLINGLAPHINVIQIGGTTYGKNVGSITLYDYIDNNNPPTKNPNHRYAMQPIVLRIANSEGFADYSNGLIPSVELRESGNNMGVLGDPSEPFLAAALQHISGAAKAGIQEGPQLESVVDPEWESSSRMFVENVNVDLKGLR